jgi:hypothetical protein
MTIARPMFPPPRRGERALPLSALFVDRAIAEAFARAELEPGMPLTVPAPSSVAPAGNAAVLPPHEVRAFDENLQSFCFAARLAYAMATGPHKSVGAALRAAREAGADPDLGPELLDVVLVGQEIGQMVVELLAAVRHQLEEVVR